MTLESKVIRYRCSMCHVAAFRSIYATPPPKSPTHHAGHPDVRKKEKKKRSDFVSKQAARMTSFHISHSGLAA